MKTLSPDDFEAGMWVVLGRLNIEDIVSPFGASSVSYNGIPQIITYVDYPFIVLQCYCPYTQKIKVESVDIRDKTYLLPDLEYVKQYLGKELYEKFNDCKTENW